MSFRTMKTAALIVTSFATLAACGAEKVAKETVLTPNSLEDMSEDSRAHSEALLFTYEGQSDTKEQDTWTGAAACTATRTKLFGDREKFKLTAGFVSLSKTTEYGRFTENMKTYHDLDCNAEKQTAECGETRKKLAADLLKILDTEEHAVMVKQDEYKPLVDGYRAAIADGCIEAKRI